MNHLEICIGLFCLTILGLMLVLVCVPLFDIPIPSCLQQFKCVQQFFAWDDVDPHVSETLNHDALCQFLENKKSKGF